MLPVSPPFLPVLVSLLSLSYPVMRSLFYSPAGIANLIDLEKWRLKLLPVMTRVLNKQPLLLIE